MSIWAKNQQEEETYTRVALASTCDSCFKAIHLARVIILTFILKFDALYELKNVCMFLNTYKKVRFDSLILY